jgi:hypothetical protein
MIGIEAHWVGANVYLGEESLRVISLTGPYPTRVAFRHVIESVGDSSRSVVMAKNDYEMPIFELLAMLV